MNFLRRHQFIIALLVLIGAARFVILLVSQTHVHSDEAIIGLMGKHISEGRAFPFYMYGQPYNAAAALEAYLAVIPFKIFGVGVIPLKSVIVLLSLICLFLFHRMALALSDQRTAFFSTLAFALAPSLLKWHFQVRGYSFYFLAIPTLLIFFSRILTNPTMRNCFLFGLTSGLSIWFLEISLTLVAALWVLLLLWRKMSIQQFLVAAGAFLVGYAPAIFYNLTHQFANWRTVFLEKTGVSPIIAVSHLFRPTVLHHIFVTEMPKFFGPDTVLWYYPEKPWTGFIFYALALVAIAVALIPFVRRPSRLRSFFSDNALDPAPNKDLLLLVLTAACFVPYLLTPIPIASYFFGGIFFLSILTGRVVMKCFSGSIIFRGIGAAVLMSILAGGIGAMIEVGRRNEIETLTLCDGGKSYCMTRIPGADIDCVERHLLTYQVTSAWTTLSFTYPLLFETRETLAISDKIFGWEHNVYPPGIPMSLPRSGQPPVFVMESNSPMRSSVEEQLSSPLATECGTLAVIEQR